VSGTDLVNPDFLQWCEAFRVPVLAVDGRADLPKLDASAARAGAAGGGGADLPQRGAAAGDRSYGVAPEVR
jgi:hypothetical protein